MPKASVLLPELVSVGAEYSVSTSDLIMDAWANDQWEGPATQEGKRIPITPDGSVEELVLGNGTGSGGGKVRLASWVVPQEVYEQVHYSPEGPLLSLHAEPHHPDWAARFGRTPSGVEALAVGSHCVVVPLSRMVRGTAEE